MHSSVLHGMVQRCGGDKKSGACATVERPSNLGTPRTRFFWRLFFCAYTHGSGKLKEASYQYIVRQLGSVMNLEYMYCTTLPISNRILPIYVTHCSCSRPQGSIDVGLTICISMDILTCLMLVLQIHLTRLRLVASSAQTCC